MANNRANELQPAPARRSMCPQQGDDWASIAARELPGTATEDAVNLLQSWNLHVFMRPAATATADQGNPILPSDIIFVEPPLAKTPWPLAKTQ